MSNAVTNNFLEKYEYHPHPDQFATQVARKPLIIVGAGPVGLSAAIDSANYGIPVILLTEKNTLSTGSRAICYAKRTLEIWNRLGCAEPLVKKGITWKLGKVYFKGDLVYTFDLLPDKGHQMPAFINLQQYYLEHYLVTHLKNMKNVEIRWLNKVSHVSQNDDQVQVDIKTPDGEYQLACDYLIAADGSRSQVRKSLGLSFEGEVFEDKFLITDILMKVKYPIQRRFWFDPPFHQGQSALLHRQADNVWRLDFQLGRNADPEQEIKPEKVIPRIKAMIGENIDFELLWVSVYTFQCRRLNRFRHRRIIYVGDAAHQVSPFGARGANGGVQDIDNLIWKLKLVMEKKAPENLLESYNSERILAADENILHSTRSTEFITPKTESSKVLRDAVLSLSKNIKGIRPFINSGRLSTPSIYRDSSLNSLDQDEFGGNAHIGGPCIDAPILYNGKKSWFLKVLGGEFCGVYFTGNIKNLHRTTISQFNNLVAGKIPFKLIIVTQNLSFKQKTIDYPLIIDYEKELNKRYDAIPGTFYLVRPDQHIAARWKKFNLERVQQSLRKSIGYPIKKINTVKKTYKSVDHLLDIPNLKNPDDIYQNLIESQCNFDDNELKIFYARLILLLMNHIGNEQILKQAINLAQKGIVQKNKIN